MSAAALTETITKLTEADLTDRTVDGEGMFDALMSALSKHLDQEFEKDRITGAQYAEVYISLTQAAMSQAVQFLLARDQAYWQAILTQKQAQVADEQISQIAAQTDLTGAQQAQVEYQTTQLLPSQKAAVDAEKDRSIAQKNHTLAETAQVIPAQVRSMDADKAVKDYQVSDLMPAQVAGYEQDTLMKAYERSFIQPVKKAHAEFQRDVERAKIHDTRADGGGIGGTLGAQKKLHEQQVISYERDSETKVVKMLIDTWITQKTMDEALLAPTSLSNSELNVVIEKLKTNLSL